MTLDDSKLAERIGDAIGSQQAIAGWSDVKARAQRPVRARHAPRLGRTLLIAAALVLVGGSIAFALDDQIGQVLGLQTRLHPFDPAGPQPVALSVRRIAQVRLANAQGRATIWIGHDARGARCFGARSSGVGPPDVAWQCGSAVGRFGLRAHGSGVERVPVSWTLGRSEDRDSHTFAYGWVSPAVSRLQLDFQDGTRLNISLHEGYFLYAIPLRNWSAGHRPSMLRAYSSAGRPTYRQFLDPRQACVYPSDARTCGQRGGVGGTVEAGDNGGFAGTASTP
jgi:hypothetical protein